ncbi:U1 small nuclear ribonucleoprotein usp102 [Neolecta irregularis DAH-3]|uniref:U1 small nuclear ribonucleoprotein usp102 n=1 Tax=Neolecta irregularis (strain DAH-3) TaxID=1198029 RepID=A0A1U7LMG5_NEOID|nr:U1 small nuclear ribonucleoprotein usp102 [Neolecta irregularis DAH-3]|eukprot:OLL23837.1 U1 small nuclear ribonucleoprotein usp102 [Neolecta irregularis DAH-3]
MFLQNLPETINAEALTSIFRRFTGFKEIRMVPGRKGIAFVEYERDQDAVGAKQGTSGMILEGKEVKVSYARK